MHTEVCLVHLIRDATGPALKDARYPRRGALFEDMLVGETANWKMHFNCELRWRRISQATLRKVSVVAPGPFFCRHGKQVLWREKCFNCQSAALVLR